jgi:hypothetical protein
MFYLFPPLEVSASAQPTHRDTGVSSRDFAGDPGLGMAQFTGRHTPSTLQPYFWRKIREIRTALTPRANLGNR